MYIKHIELSRFKSFGSTTAIPMLPGFTVVSGPNGSGKSNILDALLFALGLSSSKGMRAERLPDLVNQAHSQKGRTVEAYVTVTFDLEEESAQLAANSETNSATNFDTNSDSSLDPNPDNTQSEAPKAIDGQIQATVNPQEWTVTRKLRVTSQGTYTSTYYVNGMPCTLGELHEQLAKLRIYPEGYNVVLQGDVTSIISMNSRDRREIIDELAGVGEFDRKIASAKDKLDDVKAQEDRFRIVEQELISTKEKLKGDRAKAEKYQALRLELEKMERSEVVLQHRALLYQKSLKEIELTNSHEKAAQLKTNLTELVQTIELATVQLNELSAKVHTLGEEEYLSVSTNLAAKNAELRSLQRQQQDLIGNYQATQNHIVTTQSEIDQLLQELEGLATQKQLQESQVNGLNHARDQQAAIVQQYRNEIQSIATSSADWMRQQGQMYQAIDTLQATIDPQRLEHTRLKESLRQWSLQLTGFETELAELQNVEGRSLEDELLLHQSEAKGAQSLIQSLSMSLGAAQMDLQTSRETIDRLTQEQRIKNRQLDKLEAQAQATREVQGTRATQIIIEADLSGVFGLVAQLGWVEPHYQLALEIAAGNRLGFLVVENDEVAAEAINLLKLERAGRATFLPLNKMQAARSLKADDAKRVGAIDYAINLVEFEERYKDIFGFIFGNTMVYGHLEQARQYIGRHRMVTLDGDLLETTGAITGGSAPSRNGIHFGTAEASESNEVKQLRDRLMEIDQMLSRLNQKVRMSQTTIAKYEEQLLNARNAHREAQLQSDLIQEQIGRTGRDRDRIQEQIHQTRTAIELGQAQVASIELTIAGLEAQLQVERAQLSELEQSSTHIRWQQAQEVLQAQEALLNTAEIDLRTARQQLASNENQNLLALEKVSQRQVRLQELRTTQTDLLNESSQAQTHIKQAEGIIATLQARLDGLEQVIGATKQERDACDRALSSHRTSQQEQEWQLQKLIEQQAELTEQIAKVNLQLEQLELPDPLPEVPAEMNLEQLQLEQRRLQKRLQAMEPVNMMAIAEYESTTARLDELSARLETLNQERTELLLRIENFTTLRQRSFMQAFDAVNQNFKTIFAELSDGDGYLQLENPSAPLSGGLNLVAHPKGKPVQHLASMSGGEKSLTALSFIFALQRYRPSPFYAFDEVDMFLDGSNVERLASMVRKQADSAQFIVVSLRRPMIDKAERTIGVTQARGAHTQVLGLELRTS
ncbi:chromosome segregation protein SMC [Tumidithrix elongata RA019]|uniref:Chromosome partition protein Smc n=1 Tax=Tumidithrix elongata BACA0141 TaxID=2716417 RepID=A0AAW9PTB4_9CYAN|nr:chromosome segregation protein SMC [Tumidithrix elongata RA019]